MAEPSFDDLPDAVKSRILASLPFPEMLRFRLVSKAWAELTTDPELWRHPVLTSFHHTGIMRPRFFFFFFARPFFFSIWCGVVISTDGFVVLSR